MTVHFLYDAPYHLPMKLGFLICMALVFMPKSQIMAYLVDIRSQPDADVFVLFYHTLKNFLLKTKTFMENPGCH